LDPRANQDFGTVTLRQKTKKKLTDKVP
jgi:hypothetical protein